jgi:hypothetical protein
MDASLHPPTATHPTGSSRRGGSGAAARPPPAPMRRAGAPGANPAAAPSLVDSILGPGVLDWREGLGGARGAAPVGRGRVTPGLGRAGDPSDTALNAVVPQVRKSRQEAGKEHAHTFGCPFGEVHVPPYVLCS